MPCLLKYDILCSVSFCVTFTRETKDKMLLKQFEPLQRSLLILPSKFIVLLYCKCLFPASDKSFEQLNLVIYAYFRHSRYTIAIKLIIFHLITPLRF